MATHVNNNIDAENQGNAIDEQTPLINDHSPIEESTQDGIEPKPKGRSWYAWRIFWAIVIALVLSVFIKGWIDAGADVDVGWSPSHKFNMAQNN